MTGGPEAAAGSDVAGSGFMNSNPGITGVFGVK
jgi:hypothetical protein